MIQVPNGITTSYFSEGQCVPSTWRFGTGSFHAKRLIFDWSKLIAFLFDHSFRGISVECNYGIRLSSIPVPYCYLWNGLYLTMKFRGQWFDWWNDWLGRRSHPLSLSRSFFWGVPRYPCHHSASLIRWDRFIHVLVLTLPFAPTKINRKDDNEASPCFLLTHEKNTNKDKAPWLIGTHWQTTEIDICFQYDRK